MTTNSIRTILTTIFFVFLICLSLFYSISLFKYKSGATSIVTVVDGTINSQSLLCKGNASLGIESIWYFFNIYILYNNNDNKIIRPPSVGYMQSPVCFPDFEPLRSGCASCEQILKLWKECIPKWKITTIDEKNIEKDKIQNSKSTITTTSSTSLTQNITNSNNELITINKCNKNEICPPSLFMIGAMRTGSTTLHEFCVRQKGFEPAQVKEIHYYDAQATISPNSHNISSNLKSYTKLFPKCDDCITGDFTPNYILCPSCADAILSDWKNAKFVLTLRDPVDRATSHYRHHLAKAILSWIGMDEGASDAIEKTMQTTFRHDLEDLVNAELQDEEALEGGDGGNYDPLKGFRLWADNKFDLHSNHLIRGIYYDQIKIWREKVEKHRLLILNSIDLWDEKTRSCALVAFMRYAGLPKPDEKDIPLLHIPKNIEYYYPEPPKKEKIIAEEMTTNFYKYHNERLYNYLKRDLKWRK